MTIYVHEFLISSGHKYKLIKKHYRNKEEAEELHKLLGGTLYVCQVTEVIK
ncbi:MAG: hypothetical protein [Bacteriophage sp.]|nr:MAG: hypothetical protein [Bacteriophage sp.]